MIARSLRRILPLAVTFAAVVAANADTSILNTPATFVTPSPRSVAMGRTGGADDRDPMNSYFNPAVLGTQTGIAATFFTGEYSETFFGDLDLTGVDVAGGHAFRAGSSTVGVGGQIRYANLAWGEAIITNPQGQSLGTFKQNDGYVSVSLAGTVQLENGLAAGVGGTYRRYEAEYGGGMSTDATGWDAGLLASYTFGEEETLSSVAAGVSFINASTDVKGPYADASLLKSTHFALSARTTGSPAEVLHNEVPSVELVFNVDVNVPEGDFKDAYRVGAEFAIFRIGFIRLGWIKDEAHDGSSLVGGGGVGLPFPWAAFRLDYASIPLQNIGTEEDVTNRDHKASLTVTVPLQRLAAQ